MNTQFRHSRASILKCNIRYDISGMDVNMAAGFLVLKYCIYSLSQSKNVFHGKVFFKAMKAIKRPEAPKGRLFSKVKGLASQAKRGTFHHKRVLRYASRKYKTQNLVVT